LRNENTLPSWFFEKSWRNQTLRLYDEPGERPPRTCLVFEDGTGLCETLMDRLEKENGHCIRVKSGGEFKAMENKCYQIHHREASHYRRLIKEIEKSNLQIDDIIFLFTSRYFQGEGMDIDDRIITDIHARGVYSLLHLLQALEGRSHRVKRLLVVTSNTQFTGPDDRVAYEKCSIPGFLKSLSLELDWLQCCHVDLDADPDLEPKTNDIYAECL
ncbi:MAG: hypothetical protein GY940_31235, partial [bacterium]|nr:hypothetical protein [bacterium]